ncbi:MAG: hypothetical protein WA956_01695 [Stenotrophomonas sp.]
MNGRLFRVGALVCLGMVLTACKPPEPEVRPLPASAQTTPPEAAPTAPVAAAATQLADVGKLHVGAAFGQGPGDDAFQSAGMRELMEGDCEYYEGGSLPPGLSMMVIADRIARFDARDERTPDAEGPPLPFGLWVGMTEAAARERLPAGVVASPHAYASPDGEYLTWTDPQATLALRLETLDGVVTAIYWGQPEAVELIEGCA